MKNKNSFGLFAALVCALSFAFAIVGCQSAQAGASAAYIAAEVGTTQILQKHQELIPVAASIVKDWSAFQGGHFSAADEAGLLQQIVASTKGQVTPTQAALLDGAVQQILANQNATAPTPLQGAAGAIITDVINGIARALVIYTPPAS